MLSQSRLGSVAHFILLWSTVPTVLGCALDKTPESRGLRAAAQQPTDERGDATLPDAGPKPLPDTDPGPIYLPDAVIDDAAVGSDTDAGPGCSPHCQGRECGSDGCASSCGRCGEQQECDDKAGTCQAMPPPPPPCVPACDGRECGDDGCGGSCGTCPNDAACTSAGQCPEAMPECGEDCSPEPLPTASERCLELVATDASAACKQCACENCTQLTNACYVSGDQDRDTRCAMLAECGNRKGCYDEECYCGDSFLCLAPDGLCKAETELSAGSTDLVAIRTCYDDPDCASYRARALGECLVRDCAEACRPSTGQPVPD